MRRIAIVAVLAALVVACSGGGSATPTATATPTVPSHGTGHAPTTEPDGSPESVADLGELMAEVRGHLIVSRELFALDDLEGARAHGTHPLAELQALLGPAVEAAGGDRAAFDASLADAAAAVDASADAAALDATYDATDQATFDAEAAIAGDAADTPAYIASVIGRLLDTVGHEYEEAVATDGSIELLLEYQDAYAFVREAQRLYGEIEADVTAAGAEEAGEIDEAFEALVAALAEPMPPDAAAPIEDVTGPAALIGHELVETVDALPVEETDAAAQVEEIGHILEHILEAYEEGDADEAAELAAEAYLEHYEIIEADVIEYAPEINAELEPLLGAELRRQIQEGAPIEDIQTMVERAKELLEQALQILEAQEGS